MIKLGLLLGGLSTEREVSLMSADEILKNLDKNKYDVRCIEIDTKIDWIRDLLDNPPDIALSALHGGIGEDGSVQGLLECMQIPYVGSKVMSSAICMDKNMSKFIMRANNIPVPEHIFISRFDALPPDLEYNVSGMGFPLVVKPNRGGSSVGVSIVRDISQLSKAIEEIKNMGDDVLIEEYITGREVTCGVIEKPQGVQVLTVLDIDSANYFYDYDAKYSNEMTKIEFSTLPEFLQVMISEIAKKVFVILGCTGYGRVDMIVREEQIYVLEMNTLPGLTSHSLVPKAATGVNMPFGDFLNHLIDYELYLKAKEFEIWHKG